ncbi:nucleotidyltransferase domain-containing protein [Patescibacteria group bacterium]|nr:nucleotidyltransferase domain-containing protein [Patescibacteria group bacterium]
MMIDKEKIKTILEKHGVAVGYLFGSALRGTMGPHSDIDVGVLFEKDLPDEEDFDRRRKLAAEMSEVFKVPDTDVINLKTARGPLIKYNAIFGGELILEKNKETRLALERAVVRDYEDSRPLRRIRHFVLREELQKGTFGKSAA